MADVELSRRLWLKPVATASLTSPMLFKRAPRPASAILSPRPEPEVQSLAGCADEATQASEFRRPAIPPARSSSQQVHKKSNVAQEPILRLLNLQLQHQRCCRLQRFFKVEENVFFFSKRTGQLVAL
jgi:hypothetical protein